MNQVDNSQRGWGHGQGPAMRQRPLFSRAAATSEAPHPGPAHAPQNSDPLGEVYLQSALLRNAQAVVQEPPSGSKGFGV